MTLRARVRRSASEEIAEAAAWYDSRAPGLGREFLGIVDGGIEKARASPLRFRPVVGKARRVLLDRFPYALFYLPTDEEIVVLAVLHQRASPKRWPRR